MQVSFYKENFCNGWPTRAQGIQTRAARIVSNYTDLGGQRCTMVSILASRPNSLGLIPSIPKKIQLNLINGAAQRKVDSGLKMLIEPI